MKAATIHPGPGARESHDVVLEVRGVGHAFGENRVLHDINIEIVRGQIVALVGPSGSGKSTLLRAILGTHLPSEGEVLMNGRAVRGPGRDRGIVYQKYSLFPFLTAVENVGFGLMLDQSTPARRLFRPDLWWPQRRHHLKRSHALLERMGLAQAAHLYPAAMSGGMCQRVAVAQALVMEPQILLMDEPFGALDEAIREEMQELLLDLFQQNRAAKEKGQQPPHTVLIVTHELNEALYVADRVLGLSQYWDWQAESFPKAPGATIMYDAVSPVFSKDSDDEAPLFVKQRNELRAAVFEPANRPPRNKYVRFWDEVAAGKGVGVLQP